MTPYSVHRQTPEYTLKKVLAPAQAAGVPVARGEVAMEVWHVTVETAQEADPPTPDRLDDLLEFLAPYGSVIGSPEEPLDGKSRYGADITVEAYSPAEAIERAIGMLGWAAEKAGLPIWPVVRVEAKTDAELDVELAQPTFPELIGVSELAQLLGTSRQRASYLARSASFPEPLARLNSGPVWTKPSVRRFLDAWQRKPGRPVKERKPA
jgi:hypothetical protein